MMKMKLYQINMDRDEKGLAFMNYEFVKRRTHSDLIDRSIYDCVFDGEVNCKSLESVFALFNFRHPEGFKGRSLSLSDVVEVTESTHVPRGLYFCDSIGFKEVMFDHREKSADTRENDRPIRKEKREEVER
jgi:hypothetical protein